MKKRLIISLLFAGLAFILTGAQKTLIRPTKKPHKTQVIPHNPNKPKARAQKKQADTMVVDYVRPQEMKNTQLKSSISLKPTGIINGHEYVDLGLSVKWATCNVGASSPSDYGSYFAWGETSTKSEYTSENYVTYKKSMSDIAGDSRYDAVRANWGGTWRLPTKVEIEELVNRCKTKWTTYNGHKGRLVTGSNGNSIFIPAAGWRDGSSLEYEGDFGNYWSSTPYDALGAYSLYFDGSGFRRDWFYRDYGHAVRPVSE